MKKSNMACNRFAPRLDSKASPSLFKKLMAAAMLAASPAALAAASPNQAQNHYLLSLDFNEPATPGKQSVDLPALSAVNGVTASQGIADFGTNAVLSQNGFPQPQGPFTIEARFLVREYAYIEDLVNTATWDDGPVQGFIFRVGGGFFYPVLPRGAYGDPSLYDKSVSDFDNTGRAELSRCVGEFAFATQAGGTAQWLEVYTDRCAERGQWNHMVAVWDGKDARIYLNGHDATDKWRLNGAGSQPKLDTSARLTVGGRRPPQGGDERHFDGKMDFVRILDTAMDAQQIRQRYQDGLPNGGDGDFCRGVLTPVTPAAGELCDKDSRFKFKVEVHGACVDPTVKWDFEPGDTAEVEFARDAGFQNVFLSFTVTDMEFDIDKALAQKGGAFSGPVYWRVRWIPKITQALAKTAADVPAAEWSDPKPLFLAYSLPVGIGSPRSAASPALGAKPFLRAVEGGYLLMNWNAMQAPRLNSLDGREVPFRAVRISPSAWMLVLPGAGHPSGGLLLLKTPGGAVPVLF